MSAVLQATGVCPVCHGSQRMPVSPDLQQYKGMLSRYDAASDTLPCNNCGGQTMMGNATGVVPLRADGTPCKHEVTGRNAGRCYTVYHCKHCNFSFDIDSGD